MWTRFQLLSPDPWHLFTIFLCGDGGDGWRESPFGGQVEREVTASEGVRTAAPFRLQHRPLTFLHRDIHWAGTGTLQQLLIGLGRLVKQLHEECACLLVLTTPDGRQLVQLLLHQAGILQRVFQAIPAPNGRRKEALLKYAIDFPTTTALFFCI